MGSKRSSRMASLGTIAAVVGAIAVTAPAPAHATTTASADNSRDGWDQNEPGLSPANVMSSDFGQLFSTQLDGQVYGQPIVVPAANGRTSTTLIAVTENDSIYGLDPATGAILWHRNVGPTWPVSDINCGDLAPNMGATATPVYDSATDTVFFTAKENDGASIKSPNWYMYAVDPGSGNDRHARTLIQGSPTNYPGTSFNAYVEGGRPGLLLLGGTVYAAFGSICDLGAYRGYVVGVDAATGQQNTMWTTENTGTYSGGGIWMGGGGIMSDGPGRMFVTTGNGLSPAASPGTTPPGSLAESVIRLQVNTDKSLSAADFFSPANASSLDLNDQDLGSGGSIALPDSFGAGTTVPHLMVQVGKDGRVFLLNRDNLGGRGQGPNGTDAAVQVLGPYKGIWGHPAAWSGDGSGGYVYTIGNGDVLRAFRAGKDANNNPTLSMAGASTQNFWYTSGSPVVTSDGTTPGSATVWAVDASGGNGANSVLTAYNAVPDSTGTLQQIGSWPIGTAAKFMIAGTDSNRVYLGTRDGTVIGFGRPANSAVSGPSTDFGKVETGGAGVTQNVTLTAHQNVTINSLSITNPMFTTPALSSPVTLTNGQTYTVPVTFNPTTAGATWGILTANATVNGTAGKYSVGLSGTGTHSGLSATPSPVNFTTKNAQPTGTTTTIGVRINNTGTTAETVGTPVFTNDSTGAFSVTGLPAAGTVIPAQSGIDFTASYTPSVAGTQNATITIPDSDGTLTIPLTGTAIVAVRNINVTPWPLDFGSVPVGQSKTETFTVTNTGNVDATITKAKAPIGGEFSVAAPINEGTVIGVGQSLDVQVTYTPTAAGPATAQYEITSDTGQGAMELPLTGTTPSEFTASPNPVAFQGPGGNGQPTGTTATTTVHVTNSGPAPETFDGIAGLTSGQFAVTGEPANGTSIAPGSGFDLTVAYSPTAVGTQTDSIIVDDPGDPLTIPVSGTSIAAVRSLSVNPASQDFGSVAVGQSKTEPFTFTNTGNAPVTISGVTAPTGGQFSFNPPVTTPTSIAAGQSLTVNVTYTPTAAGPTTDQFAITSDANQGPATLTVPLKGSTVSEFTTATTPVSFQGPDGKGQPTGVTATTTVHVTNGGSAPEEFDGIAGLTSGQFTVTGAPASGSVIQPGAGFDLSVSYAPNTVGTQSDSIIVNDAGDPFKIPLSGTSIAAVRTLTVNSSSQDFGSIPVGQSKNATFTFTNSGNAPVTITGVTSPTSGQFSVASPIALGTVIGAGQSVTVHATFKPTAVGAFHDQYTVTANTAQGSLTIPLAGTGGATEISRLAGGDRYGTGVAVSQAQWADAGGDTTGRAQAHEVVLARGDQFPDALAGVPLAADVKGPLLLTDPKALTQATEDEIRRVLPRGGTVDILGLSGAVSDTVANRLTQLGYHVTRYGGPDRYATARAIAERIHPSKVILATGWDYADALSAGPFATGPAATNGVPAAILLTDDKTLDPATESFVKSVASTSTQASPTVFAVGGHAATAAASLGGFVQDFVGSDRYATDALVVQAFAKAGSPTHLGIATGLSFADALTGGAYTATQGGAMVIIPSALGPQATQLLNALGPKLATVTMFGGTSVISPFTAGQIADAVQGRVG